jgi:solute carrier family 25 phosphate transporter 3
MLSILLFSFVALLFAHAHAKIVLVHSSLLGLRGGSSEDGKIGSLDWRYFAAGGICAATSHGITTPIDVVKTRMQQNPEKYSKGVIAAAKDIVATEGLGFLLAGLGPTVGGYGIEGALKFGFYETFKVIFANVTPMQFVNFLLASVVAGAVASVVLCPMEETRIKMVGDVTWTKENLISGLVRLVRENGILSTFAGLPAMLSKQVPYTMGKQVSFDIITKLIYAAVVQYQLSSTELKWPISVLSAFIASIFACISSQPGDMILTTTYKGTEDGSTNFFAVIKHIYKQRGLGGFYLGLNARLAHVASIITSQLVLYDIVKAALGLPVTGSH